MDLRPVREWLYVNTPHDSRLCHPRHEEVKIISALVKEVERLTDEISCVEGGRGLEWQRAEDATKSIAAAQSLRAAAEGEVERLKGDSDTLAQMLLDAADMYDEVKAENERLRGDASQVFNDGYNCAVANLLEMYDEPTIAEEVLRQNWPEDLNRVNPDDLATFRTAGILPSAIPTKEPE